MFQPVVIPHTLLLEFLIKYWKSKLKNKGDKVISNTYLTQSNRTEEKKHKAYIHSLSKFNTMTYNILVGAGIAQSV
jgi:hypothetical protein